jgi:hypothetical protein
LIQSALCMLDGAGISGDEQARQFYGQGTAMAVLNYKKKRKIINYSYQTSPDDIVGRMTIRSLDTEMLAYERGKFGLLLAFGVPSPPRGVIISQSHPLPAGWARQLVRANNLLDRVESRAVTPQDIVKSIQGTIKKAGPGGLLIFAVDHGITDPNGYPSAGAFDLADGGRMRIGGLGSFSDPKIFADAFYDTRPPPGSTSPFSEKENDESTHPFGWKLRHDRWPIHQDLCQAFVNGKLRHIVLLTCRIGNSTDFLKKRVCESPRRDSPQDPDSHTPSKVASQWQTPILAYRDFVWYDGIFPNIRAVLDKDENTPGQGTNVPFSEICIPISPLDMVVVSP